MRLTPDAAEFAALIIFLFTYALISFGRLGKNSIEMPAAALLGGALMLVTGIVNPQAALSSINWGTILLIMGMMMIVSGMDLSGVFRWISSKLVRAAGTPRLFIVYVSLITAFLSALILNDAVVLIFTPVIIASARKMGISPLPPLIMEAISANIGSTATEVGNPQNAYIANISSIEFHVFTAYLLPVAVASLLFAIILAIILSRKEYVRSEMRSTEHQDEAGARVTFPMYFMAGVVFSVFTGFYLLPLSYVPVVAMVGGIVTLFALPLITGRNGQELLVKVDWGILLFFIGLFVLISGIESSGLLQLIISALTSIDTRLLSTVGGLTVLTSVLSNMVSNVPAVVLLSPIIEKNPTTRLWLSLAASSTLAGNATIIGAAANVIVARGAAREGVHISLRSFMKYGLPITVVSLLFTFLFLQFL